MPPPSTPIVRLATPADVETLVGLMREFYAEADYPLDREWAGAAFSRLFNDSELGCVWIAECQGVAVGHAVLTLRYTMEHGALSGYIDDLFVKPEFRRRHIAHTLVCELLEECRRRACRAVYVEVGDRNVPAIELYRRFGLGPLQDGRVLFGGVLGPVGT
jgi:ribosomal protein S18 acetylase RimI-like enzyme